MDLKADMVYCRQSKFLTLAQTREIWLVTSQFLVHVYSINATIFLFQFVLLTKHIQTKEGRRHKNTNELLFNWTNETPSDLSEQEVMSPVGNSHMLKSQDNQVTQRWTGWGRPGTSVAQLDRHGAPAVFWICSLRMRMLCRCSGGSMAICSGVSCRTCMMRAA